MRTALINERWEMWLPDHRAAFHESHPGWEHARLDSMSKNIQPGMVVYDVGAEEGDFSALIANWVFRIVKKGDVHTLMDGAGRKVAGLIQDPDDITEIPGGGVVLIEPGQPVWANIRTTFVANALPAPLYTFVGFAGPEARPGSQEFMNTSGMAEPWPRCSRGEEFGDGHGFSHLWERDDIPVIPLDNIRQLLDRRVDALTIDVEGAELEVMKGAERIITEDRPLVWVSVHPEFMALLYHQYENDLHSWFGAHNYAVKHLDFDHEHHYFCWPAERTVQL